MTTDTPQKVCDFLNGLKHGLCENAVPVKATIHFNKKTDYVFYGAKYDAIHVCIPTERDVTDGTRKAGDRVAEPAFYLVGKLDWDLLAQRRDGSHKYCFRIAGDDGDWFIAGYHLGANTDPTSQPFGAWFALRRWNHEKPWMGMIDQYADTPDIRLKTEVQYL